MIAFSASPGTVAKDSPGQRSGTFTAALLTHFRIKGRSTDVRMIMATVRTTVQVSTSRRQRPWYYDSLPDTTVLLFPAGSPVETDDCNPVRYLHQSIDSFCLRAATTCPMHRVMLVIVAL